MRTIPVICFTAFCVFGLFEGVASFPEPKNQGERCYQANEEFIDCGPSCPKTCDTMLIENPSFFCPELCVPGCFCKEGYVRNRWGNCISKEKCPCQGEEEEYSCGSACQVTCATLNQPCTIFTYVCVQMCRCRDGFARDNNGICIPQELCPNSGYNKIKTIT